VAHVSVQQANRALFARMIRRGFQLPPKKISFRRWVCPSGSPSGCLSVKIGSQWVNNSVHWSVSQLVRQFVSLTVSHLVGQSVCQSVHYPVLRWVWLPVCVDLRGGWTSSIIQMMATPQIQRHSGRWAFNFTTICSFAVLVFCNGTYVAWIVWKGSSGCG